MSEVTIRTAEEKDLDALLKLQQTVARNLPFREMFAVDGRDFYEPVIRGRGQILLAIHDGKTVGAGIVVFPDLSDPENLGRELGFPSEILGQVVHIESVYILPEFRGQKLARILTEKNLELAEQRGRKYALSTVWPGNASSMSFLYELGLTVRKLTRKYGGLDRFIMLRVPYQIETGGPKQTVPCLDMEGHRKQLAQGKIGVGLLHHADGMKNKQGSLDFSITYQALY